MHRRDTCLVLNCTAGVDMRRQPGRTHGAYETETGRMLFGCETENTELAHGCTGCPRRPMIVPARLVARLRKQVGV